MANPSGLIPRKYYDQYNKSYDSMPGEMADPESFYTPELQESMMAELSRSANENNAVNQASISGGSITNGFGVGNTSREQTRRAKADAQALDEIVNGYVNQAAQIEDMRQSQSQDFQSRKAGAQEKKLNDEQDFRLSRQGYGASEDSQAQGYSDAASQDRQDMLFGGIGALGGAAGNYFGNRTQPFNSTPQYANPNLPPNLSPFGGSPSGAMRDRFAPTSIFGG